ncbi:MAG: glycosyltransferase [Flavobacteriaceae bacterium]|nr:glycosyltransferase [Flavobacteriaceae bacterium]
MPKVSVIVPVYNGAKYIRRAIDSLLKQSLYDIEIIVVDDGSTDDTLNIVKSIVDEKIRILSKVNEGVSIARNVGIEIARGEYIGFVDADDFVNIDMYETLYSKANDADVVSSVLWIEREGKYIQKENVLKHKEYWTKQDFIKEVLEIYLAVEHLDLLSVVNKIYRREFLLEYNILFSPALSIEEDGIFNLQVYLTMHAMMHTMYSGYYYLENKESKTRDVVAHKVFEKLIQRFNYDYSQMCDIAFSESELLSFKSSRLIHSICFLVFRTATQRMSLTNKMRYISRILKDKDVQIAAEHLNNHYMMSSSMFEKMVVYSVKSKRVILVKGLVLFLTIADKIGVMYWVRKLNDIK